MKKIIAIVLALAVLASSAVFAANAASKVTGVRQIGASDTSFKIAWNDDFGVNRYKIEYSANGASGDYSEDTSYASNFEHSVYSRQAGRTYYVKVTPYINNRWATEKTSDPYPVATAPNAPSNIKQTGATANSYTISWSGSYGATAYVLRREPYRHNNLNLLYGQERIQQKAARLLYPGTSSQERKRL